jgi:hypothetical protein
MGRAVDCHPAKDHGSDLAAMRHQTNQSRGVPAMQGVFKMLL